MAAAENAQLLKQIKPISCVNTKRWSVGGNFWPSNPCGNYAFAKHPSPTPSCHLCAQKPPYPRSSRNPRRREAVLIDSEKPSPSSHIRLPRRRNIRIISIRGLPFAGLIKTLTRRGRTEILRYCMYLRYCICVSGRCMKGDGEQYRETLGRKNKQGII